MLSNPYLFFCRRVHITEATLSHLGGEYEVEDVTHMQRDPYLKEHNIKTYLVIDPRVSRLVYLYTT